MSFKLDPKRRKPGKNKLSLEFIINFYDLMLRERNLSKAAAALGIEVAVLKARLEKSGYLQLALKLADERRPAETLSNYVFKCLSPEARKTWDEVRAAHKNTREVNIVQVIDRIFGSNKDGKKLRQELFVHALVCSGYDISKACRMVGISSRVVGFWKEDLHFLGLLEEVQFHKKNFFERALIGLVEEGHPGAVVFVNRTLNADRGYSEKLQVDHSGVIGNSVTGGVTGSGLSLEDLDLDVETRRKILEAIRRKKEKELLLAGSNGNVVDVVDAKDQEVRHTNGHASHSLVPFPRKFG